LLGADTQLPAALRAGKTLAINIIARIVISSLERLDYGSAY
jgi:hypothetical protein